MVSFNVIPKKQLLMLVLSEQLNISKPINRIRIFFILRNLYV
ncbi:hypothetical protein T190820D02B_10668 [Tenacibaculum sp. 190524A05c]